MAKALHRVNLWNPGTEDADHWGMLTQLSFMLTTPSDVRACMAKFLAGSVFWLRQWSFVTSMEMFLELMQHSARGTKEQLSQDKPIDINPYLMVVQDGRLSAQVILSGNVSGQQAIEQIGEVAASCVFGFDADALGFVIDLDIDTEAAIDREGMLVGVIDKKGRMMSALMGYRHEPHAIVWSEPLIDSALTTVTLRWMRRQISMAFSIPKAGHPHDLLVETARRLMNNGHAVMMMSPPADTVERLRTAGVVINE